MKKTNGMLVQIESLQTENEINDTQWKTQIDQLNVKITVCHSTTNDAIPISTLLDELIKVKYLQHISMNSMDRCLNLKPQVSIIWLRQ